MKVQFIAEYKAKENRPNEPILVGRDQSQARISVDEAKQLINQLKRAVSIAEMTTNVECGRLKNEK